MPERGARSWWSGWPARQGPRGLTTRKEQQARTARALMDSARGVFVRRGIERASRGRGRRGAGFTKGAFYANFASKEELFLAMLDEHFDERLAEIERILSTEADPRRAGARGAEGLMRMLRGRPRVAPPVLRVRRLRGAQRAIPDPARGALPRPARASRRAAGAPGRAARHRAGGPRRARRRDDVRDGERRGVRAAAGARGRARRRSGRDDGAFFTGLRARAGAPQPPAGPS